MTRAGDYMTRSQLDKGHDGKVMRQYIRLGHEDKVMRQYIRQGHEDKIAIGLH